MSFNKEGSVKIKITEVTFADAKFAEADPSAFDICLKCEGVGENAGMSDWWRGEMSNNMGKGTVSHLTQAQLTFRTLRKLGFKGDDLTSLDGQINGVETEGFVKASEPNASGKVFYNLRYIGPSDFTPTSIDNVAERMKALMKNAPAPIDDAGEAAAPKPAPAPKAKTKSPFG